MAEFFLELFSEEIPAGLQKNLRENLLEDFQKYFLKKTIRSKKNFSLSSQLYNSVDQIWFIAGDSSSDFNFYTKRLILSIIYSRVMLFFFNNNNQEELENILDESLQRVSKIPEIKSKLKIFKDYLPKIANFVKNTY